LRERIIEVKRETKPKQGRRITEMVVVGKEKTFDAGLLSDVSSFKLIINVYIKFKVKKEII